jgi:dienelactone hydrolase
MEHKTGLMLGAAAAALAGGPALAAPQVAPESAVPVAASYAELLEPIPNAVERLRASDAEAAARPAQLILAQNEHHHHHHHDSNWYRQNGYVFSGGRWVLAAAAHHHHHHHSRSWYRHHGYRWDGSTWVLAPAPHHHHHHHNNY